MDFQFAGQTFFAKSHPGDLCGSNGLPLTPNSITIYGRAQFLKTIKHPYLCSYLDIIRGKHERTVIVSEYYQNHLPSQQLSHKEIIKISYQILQALSHLNELDLVHRNISPDNILLDKLGNVKLFSYGTYYMTGYGADVIFPIGKPKYTAPEVYLCGMNLRSGPKVDVWSLGIVLAEQCLGKNFWGDLKLAPCMRKVLSLLYCNGTILERLAREHNCWEQLQAIPGNLRNLIETCLTVSLSDRPTPKQLLEHQCFDCLTSEPAAIEIYDGTNGIISEIGLRKDLSIDEVNKRLNKCLLLERPLSEIYYLWNLAGGDVNAELRKHGLIRSKAPILSLPNLVLLEGIMFGHAKDQASMLDLKVVPLPLDTLYQRLEHVPLTSYFPLIEIKSDVVGNTEELDASCLPLVIRERDTEYQFHRIILYDRLLKGYPYKKPGIFREARQDIPPFFRGDIWASLLDVGGDIKANYIALDKETPTHTDRQIEVDIPRCHQYDELLSSTEGHKKFKRVLKAWVVDNPQYVYWQGLDSLCAPFLYLNFNKEAQAFACLSSFIPKYLHKFFLKDNSSVIQEYLATFSHLIAFHDPPLANHLGEIAFVPELFAIPWFLTMFSHVFPLHKIFHLWDKLLLGDASFPLFVGLAILKQLRDTLLGSGFNECILLFSDLPEIDIERCVADSIELYCSTPRSVTYRQHELHFETDGKDSDLEMNSIPVPQLQKEFCPRISGTDLIDLLDMSHMKFLTPKAVAVDIRGIEEYQFRCIPGSINIPYTTQGIGETVFPDVTSLHIYKGKVIVVVGNNGCHDGEFARYLVEIGFPRVCFLHNGIQCLRSSNILVTATP